VPAEQRGRICAAIKERYQAVAQDAHGHFKYPVGRASAIGLGYDPAAVDAVPREIVDRFVGVGNPMAIRTPRAGERVLDVGCGSGFDTFVASRHVGPAGRAVGIDLTAEMLSRARTALPAWEPHNVEFHEGSAEDLPFADESFDLVISNGALNLVPDKDRAYREIWRVLRKGGTLAVADLFVVESIPDEVLAREDAWST
jgi:SAM-dependent methyltransferase